MPAERGTSARRERQRLQTYGVQFEGDGWVIRGRFGCKKAASAVGIGRGIRISQQVLHLVEGAEQLPPLRAPARLRLDPHIQRLVRIVVTHHFAEDEAQGVVGDLLEPRGGVFIAGVARGLFGPLRPSRGGGVHSAVRHHLLSTVEILL
jgi:hypothetical protein